ncbi:DUF1501 domain-containing protein [Crocinitomix algicola]|uniref:DUF1501 domain-containing protein n=1 Tax=Crocinitomix algicola TaxID=1740263 RepID=UPI00087228B2|nr:DUF1501 domain-containing protein [Crocinitomix algicola]
MCKEFENSRRKFLKQLGVATALGFTSPLSSLAKFKSINSIMSSPPPPPFGDYKAIVCIFLHGGNDSYNMLVPRSLTEYDHYNATRSNLALEREDLLSIESGDFGLNPSMSALQSMYNDGDLAFLANIGTLVEPITVADYYAQSKQVPLGLFSHLDQYKHWQSSRPNERVTKGWGGYMADLLGYTNSNDKISMNVSLSGTNIFQNGVNTTPFAMNNNGPTLPVNYYAEYGHNPQRRAAVDSMLNYTFGDPFQNTYANVLHDSISAGVEFKEAIDEVPEFSTVFSPERLSQELQIIAKTIAARETLGFERQIFFVRYGGWDHHDQLITSQGYQLSVVNNAMAEFRSVLNEIGMFDNVTTFVGSEFARKLLSNGNGSDHGWGGNTMVMGGNVNGGNIFGTYPSLEIDGPEYLYGGITVPTTPIDSMYAELALWYGLSPSDLGYIFPNLSNFHTLGDLSTDSPPIGFMNM